MSKWEDAAQDLEMLERNSILAAKRKTAEKLAKKAFSHCEDCGDEIDKRRVAGGGVTRCMPCQVDFESKKKRGLC